MVLISTIFPVLLHGAVSLLGAHARAPGGPRRCVANLLRDAPETAWGSALAPLAVGRIRLLPFLVIGGILAGLRWISADALEVIGDFYLDTLLALAPRIGAF